MNPTFFQVLIKGVPQTRPEDRVGFWSPANSPINWCESDYHHSFYVAELWNTVTNLAYIVVGIEALLKCRSRRLPLSFGAAAVCTILTGIFSGMFHMSLKYHWQRLDEVFENGILIYMLHWSTSPPPSALLRGTLHFLVASLLILTVHSFLFCEIHLVSTAVLVVLRFRALAVVSSSSSSSSALSSSSAFHHVRLAGLFAVFGALAWLVDRTACSAFEGEGRLLPFNPQLHAFGWHVLTSRALREGFCLMAMLSDDKTKKKKN